MTTAEWLIAIVFIIFAISVSIVLFGFSEDTHTWD